MIKPQTLKGFRDFLPDQVIKRNFVVEKVKEVFVQFGFEPLETPTLEYASLLLGKYGTEADKLVYTFKDRGDREIGLRFDQTVPTARVLAQYQYQLPRYFRRYQIQNVYRAEKPQKGRFREFMQCDIDIFGSTNPLSDAEIIACTYYTYQNIGFKNIEIRINDRKILFETLSPFATEQITVYSIIQTIDKIGKFSDEEIRQELISKGINKSIVDKVMLKIMKTDLRDDINPLTENLRRIENLTKKLGVPSKSIFRVPHLARGLDYYTGMIFEVVIPGYEGGSVGGGGRYDELIEKLGGVSIPAVGIAFGFDRMVEAADQLGLIPSVKTGTQILVTVFDSALLYQSIEITNLLRRAKFATEIYIEPSDKLDKQLKYADKKGIPYAVIVGPEEVAKNVVKLKDLHARSEKVIALEKLTETINKLTN